jgi:hypothetical protein
VKRLLLSGVLSLGCLGAAFAQENLTYQCQRDADMRTVAIEYASPAGAQSCSITYKKVAASADPAKELWRYQSHLDRCSPQAAEFVKKLEGLGLTCTADRPTAMKQ